MDDTVDAEKAVQEAARHLEVAQERCAKKKAAEGDKEGTAELRGGE